MTLFDDLIYVGIIGTRRRDGPEAYFAIKAEFLKIYVPERTVIVSGGCPQGGDRLAEVIAAELGMPRQNLYSDIPMEPMQNSKGQRIVLHMPDVDAFRHIDSRWRKTTANYHRNGLIARDSRDALIACVAESRTGGTEDTIRKYLRLKRSNLILV